MAATSGVHAHGCRVPGRLAPGGELGAGWCRRALSDARVGRSPWPGRANREILVLLLAGERPVTELAQELGMTQPGASKHLRVLREVGLVRDRRWRQRRPHRGRRNDPGVPERRPDRRVHDLAFTRAVRLRNPPVRGHGCGSRGPGAGPRGALREGDAPDLRRPGAEGTRRTTRGGREGTPTRWRTDGSPAGTTSPTAGVRDQLTRCALA